MGTSDQDGDGDLPTLLMLGTGDPLCAALEEALGGYATFVEAAASENAVSSVLAAAPDLVVLLGDAAENAETILQELSGNAATAVVPVVILSENASLDARLQFSRHGAVAVVPKSASLDEMARRISALAKELPERSGTVLGEVGEATLDELVELLGAKVKSGILSISPAGADTGARVVLRSGRPVAEAIADFVARIRPLIESSEPLRYEFHESPTGRLDVLDADTVGNTDPSVLAGRRVLLVEEKVARADMLAQELRALGAQVVVTDAEGGGLARARALDPELLLVNEDGLDGWAYGVMSELRRDAGLRWASVLVVREEELWTNENAPPRLDRLIAGVSALLAPDLELTQRAKQSEPFEIRLETLGPTRTLRALAQAGLTHHLTVRHPRAMVEIDLAEGLIAGAEATFMGDASPRVGGPEALSTFLVLSSGRIHVERRERPAAANLLAPVEDAVASARQETPPIKPSLPPPAPAHTPRAKDSPKSGDAAALVERLEGLLSRLEERLPDEGGRRDSDAPTSTLRAALPRIPPPPRAPAIPGIAPPPKPLAPPKKVAPPKPLAPPKKVALSKSRRGRTLIGTAAPPDLAVPAHDAPAGAWSSVPAPAPPSAPAHDASAASEVGDGAGADDAVAVGVPMLERETRQPRPTPPFPFAAQPMIVAPALPQAVMPAPESAAPESAAPEIAAPEIAAPEIAAPDVFATPAVNAPEAPIASPEPLTLPRFGPSPWLLLGVVGLSLLVGAGYAVYRAVANGSSGEALASDAASGAPPALAHAAADLARDAATAQAPAIVRPDAGQRDAGRPAPEDAGRPDAMADSQVPMPDPLAPDEEVADAVGDDDLALEDATADDSTADDSDMDSDSDPETAGLPTDRRGRISALLRAGNFQRHQGRHAVAAARYREVLRLDRDNGRAMAGLARVELSAHHPDQAVRWARSLVHAHPNQASNRVLLGDALAASGNQAGARRAWQAALQKDPRNSTARRRLGQR